jgi:uncharacterized membrane protein YkgB
VLKTMQKCSRYLLHDWMWVKAIKLDWIQSNVLVILPIVSVPFFPCSAPRRLAPLVCNHPFMSFKTFITEFVSVCLPSRENFLFRPHKI